MGKELLSAKVKREGARARTGEGKGGKGKGVWSGDSEWGERAERILPVD